MIMIENAFPDTLKRKFATFSDLFPIYERRAELFKISVRTRKGKSEGITTVIHCISASAAAGIQYVE